MVMKQKVFVCYRYNDSDAGQVLANIGVSYRVAYKLIEEGYYPYIPHSDCLLAMLYGKKLPLKFYYDYTLAWLKDCDIICVVEDGKPYSSGCQIEIDVARTLGKQFIYRSAKDE